MGRKRKHTEDKTQKGKLKKVENDSCTKKEKKEFPPGDVVLVKDKGFPVWWPGKVVADNPPTATVYFHSDKSEFHVHHQNIQPYNNSIIEKSIETLKKKKLKASLTAFQSDTSELSGQAAQTSEVLKISGHDLSTTESLRHKSLTSDVSGHGSSMSDISGHGSSTSDVSGHGSSTSDVSGHGSSISDVSGHEPSTSDVSGHMSSTSDVSGHGSSTSDGSGQGLSTSNVTGHGSSTSDVSGHGSSRSVVSEKKSSTLEVSGHGSSTPDVPGHGSSISDVLGHKSSTSDSSGHKSSTQEVSGHKLSTQEVSVHGSSIPEDSVHGSSTSDFSGHKSSTSDFLGQKSSTQEVSGDESSTSQVSGLNSSTSEVLGHKSSTPEVSGHWSSTSDVSGHKSSTLDFSVHKSSTADVSGHKSSTLEASGHKAPTSEGSGHKASTPESSGHMSSTSDVAGLGSSTSDVSGLASSKPEVSGLASSTSKGSGHGSSTPEVSGHGSSTSDVSGHWSSTPEVSGHWSSTPEVSGHKSSTSDVSGHGSSTPEVSGHESSTSDVSGHEPSTVVSGHKSSKSDVSGHGSSTSEVSGIQASEVLSPEVVLTASAGQTLALSSTDFQISSLGVGSPTSNSLISTDIQTSGYLNSEILISEFSAVEDASPGQLQATNIFVEELVYPIQDKRLMEYLEGNIDESVLTQIKLNPMKEDLWEHEDEIMSEHSDCHSNDEQDPDWNASDTVSNSADSSDSEASMEYPMISKSVQIEHVEKDTVQKENDSIQKENNSVQKEIDAASKTHVHNPSDDESSDGDLDEEKLRDVKNPNLYIMKVMKSDTTKTGKKKKVDRVYNSYQYCAICTIKVSNFAQHIERNQITHEGNAYIKEIKEETDEKRKKRLRTLLRGRFNHEFNMKSIKRGKGEVILERRPTSSLNLADYGPCPICFLWVGKKLMQKHQKTCPAKTENMHIKTASELLTTSDAICERIKPIASKKLIKEVFAKLKMDKVGKIAREDILIIQLGNQWMEKNIGNKLKRGSYTSEIVRLVSRLLLNLRCVKPLNTEASLWDYLTPEHFDAIVQATLLVSSPSEEDDDSLKHPSNAIKLGFDIKRVVAGKIGLAIIQRDKKSQSDAEDLLKAMNIYWATRVTKLARVLLQQRMYRKSHKLPEPDDIKKLNEYLKAAIGKLDLGIKDLANFRLVGEAVLARLLLYNRRRPGELQAIGLADYTERIKGGNAALLGDCTEFERKLIESQEVMTVRGKTGRGVPIIVPSDTLKALDYLTDDGVRNAAGIHKENSYVFALKGDGVIRGYDALTKACNDAGLVDPKVVTCTNLRKYMATITQVLDLKPNEMEWVINHMGHSLDIHKIHYRCTSDILEKTQIAKILLLQDYGRVGEFRGKSLQEIQMEDLFQEAPPEEFSDIEAFSCNPIHATDIHEETDSDPFDFSVLDISEKLDEEYEPKPIKKRKKPLSMSREKWTMEEEEEIKKLFKKQLERKLRPTPRQCVKAIEESRAKGGTIWKRKKDVLKKKLFRMVDKLKKS